MSNSPDSGQKSNDPNTKACSLFRWSCYQWILIAIGLVVVASFSVVAVDITDHVFSTQKFCANTCHVMESTVYQELQESKHWNSPTGVRPGCANCHVSRRLTFAMLDHIHGTKELFVWAMNDFSKPGSFDKFRPEAANDVRFHMLDDNSAPCKTCHVMEAIKPQRIRGQNAHNDALKNGNSNCIACHYNLVHEKVEPSKEFLNAAAKYIGTSDETGDEQMEDEFSEDGGEVL